MVEVEKILRNRCHGHTLWPGQAPPPGTSVLQPAAPAENCSGPGLKDALHWAVPAASGHVSLRTVHSGRPAFRVAIFSRCPTRPRPFHSFVLVMATSLGCPRGSAPVEVSVSRPSRGLSSPLLWELASVSCRPALFSLPAPSRLRLISRCPRWAARAPGNARR